MIYTLEQIRDAVAPIAEKYQIPAVYLFGSYARGTATEESDLDFLIETPRVQLRGLQWGGLYNDFDEAFEKPIDLVTVRSTQQKTDRISQIHFRETINKEKVTVYELS